MEEVTAAKILVEKAVNFLQSGNTEKALELGQHAEEKDEYSADPVIVQVLALEKMGTWKKSH